MSKQFEGLTLQKRYGRICIILVGLALVGVGLLALQYAYGSLEAGRAQATLAPTLFAPFEALP